MKINKDYDTIKVVLGGKNRVKKKQKYILKEWVMKQ